MKKNPQSQLLRKRRSKSALYTIIYRDILLCNRYIISLLFAYAEVGEDIFQNIVVGDVAGDFGEGVDCRADILSQ